jgi:hypothetical protein
MMPRFCKFLGPHPDPLPTHSPLVAATISDCRSVQKFLNRSVSARYPTSRLKQARTFFRPKLGQSFA